MLHMPPSWDEKSEMAGIPVEEPYCQNTIVIDSASPELEQDPASQPIAQCTFSVFPTALSTWQVGGLGLCVIWRQVLCSTVKLSGVQPWGHMALNPQNL